MCRRACKLHATKAKSKRCARLCCRRTLKACRGPNFIRAAGTASLGVDLTAKTWDLLADARARARQTRFRSFRNIGDVLGHWGSSSRPSQFSPYRLWPVGHCPYTTRTTVIFSNHHSLLPCGYSHLECNLLVFKRGWLVSAPGAFAIHSVYFTAILIESNLLGAVIRCPLQGALRSASRGGRAGPSGGHHEDGATQ